MVGGKQEANPGHDEQKPDIRPMIAGHLVMDRDAGWPLGLRVGKSGGSRGKGSRLSLGVLHLCLTIRLPMLVMIKFNECLTGWVTYIHYAR